MSSVLEQLVKIRKKLSLACESSEETQVQSTLRQLSRLGNFAISKDLIRSSKINGILRKMSKNEGGGFRSDVVRAAGSVRESWKRQLEQKRKDKKRGLADASQRNAILERSSKTKGDCQVKRGMGPKSVSQREDGASGADLNVQAKNEKRVEISGLESGKQGSDVQNENGTEQVCESRRERRKSSNQMHTMDHSYLKKEFSDDGTLYSNEYEEFYDNTESKIRKLFFVNLTNLFLEFRDIIARALRDRLGLKQRPFNEKMGIIFSQIYEEIHKDILILKDSRYVSIWMYFAKMASSYFENQYNIERSQSTIQDSALNIWLFSNILLVNLR